MAYDRYKTADYVLPMGRGYAKVDPTSPLEAFESWGFGRDWIADGSGYVLFKLNDDRKYPTRIVFSHGHGPWKIGDRYSVRHDQDGSFLGDYEVVGEVRITLGEVTTIGDVPSRKISAAVFK